MLAVFRGGGFSAGGGGRFQEEVDFLLVEAAFFEGCGFSGGGFGAALFGSFGGGGVCGVGLRLVRSMLVAWGVSRRIWCVLLFFYLQR